MYTNNNNNKLWSFVYIFNNNFNVYKCLSGLKSNNKPCLSHNIAKE